MCGIAGIYIKDMNEGNLPSPHLREQFVNELMLGIEERGKHSTGLLAVTRGGKAHLEKADIEASRFVQWRKPLPRNTRMVLCHTRFATQGSPMNLDNNHPVQHGSAFVTHNGHIRNDGEIFKEMGVERVAEVDSEAISALLNKHGINKCHLALQELEGGFAVAMYDRRVPDTLVLAKGPSSPLVVINTKKAVVWASTRSALDSAHTAVFGYAPDYKLIEWMREGEILYIQNGGVEKLSFKVKKIDWGTSTWVSSRGTTSSSRSATSTSGAIRTGSDWAKYGKDMCKCGETRYWHMGADCNKACMKAACTCTQYRKDKKATKKKHEEAQAAEAERAAELKEGVTGSADERVITVFEKGGKKLRRRCTSCSEWTDQDAMQRVEGTKYYFCMDCWGEECDGCQRVFPLSDLKFTPDPDMPSVDLYCADCVKELEKMKAEETSAKLEDVRVINYKRDKLLVKDSAVKHAAAELGVKSQYLFWMLFEAGAKDFAEENGWLHGAYETSKKVYEHALTKLDGPSCTTIPIEESSGTVTSRSSEEVGVRVFSD